MGLFGTKEPMLTDADREQLVTLERTVAKLQATVEKLTTERDELKDEVGLSKKVRELTERIEKLTIEKDRREEENAREKREVEHMVGLANKAMEQEKALAIRETTVLAKEDAAKASAKLIEEKLDFMQKRWESEVAYLKDTIISAIIERVPTVTVDRVIREGSSRPERDDGPND